jgi:hypothetical protein
MSYEYEIHDFDGIQQDHVVKGWVFGMSRYGFAGGGYKFTGGRYVFV